MNLDVIVLSITLYQLRNCIQKGNDQKKFNLTDTHIYGAPFIMTGLRKLVLSIQPIWYLNTHYTRNILSSSII
jgi:hypothetical protein